MSLLLLLLLNLGSFCGFVTRSDHLGIPTILYVGQGQVMKR